MLQCTCVYLCVCPPPPPPPLTDTNQRPTAHICLRMRKEPTYMTKSKYYNNQQKMMTTTNMMTTTTILMTTKTTQRQRQSLVVCVLGQQHFRVFEGLTEKGSRLMIFCIFFLYVRNI